MDKIDRPAIPAELKRAVLLEAGHRCAIHTCRHSTTEIHHIVPWSRCKKHEFENLIALCPNCHERANSGEIDRKSLRHYKTRLASQFEFGGPTEIRELSEKRKSDDSIAIEKSSRIGHHPKSLTGGHFQTSSFELDVEYPDIVLDDDILQAEVNAILFGFVCEEKWHVWTVSLEMRESIECYSPHSLNMSYDLSTIPDSLLSVKFAIRSYTGGAYTNNRYRTFNFILSNELRLLQQHSLGFGYDISYEELSDVCTESISAQLGVDSERVKVEETEEMFKNFNILRHGIAVSFDEHTIAGKWLGAPSVLIPYHRLGGVRERLLELGIDIR